MEESVIGDQAGRSTLDTKQEEPRASSQDEGALKGSTDAELTKIRLMRAFVESRDPSCQEVDDSTLRRFLRARDLDVEKGSAMFLKYLKWRRSFLPNGSVSPSDIADELAQGKLFSQGFDQQGRPITVAFAAKHFQNKHGGDGFKMYGDHWILGIDTLLLSHFEYVWLEAENGRFVVFVIDKLCSRMPPGQEMFCAIADIKGWAYANSDIRGYLNALTILQDYNPERLGKCFIVHAPYLFMKVWNIIYPFIDNNTKKKIVFVENKKLKSTLLEDIDESQLPEIYGGKLPLVPIQDC